MLNQKRSRAGDDGDIETEQQSAERGCGGQADDVAKIYRRIHERLTSPALDLCL